MDGTGKRQGRSMSTFSGRCGCIPPRASPGRKTMAGYSGTPLARKLGIKEGGRVFAVGAPRDYLELVAPVPEGVQVVPRVDDETDVIHIFTTAKEALARALGTFLEAMRPDATIWVS